MRCRTARALRANVALCSVALMSCLSDLKPEVGKRIASDDEDGQTDRSGAGDEGVAGDQDDGSLNDGDKAPVNDDGDNGRPGADGESEQGALDGDDGSESAHSRDAGGGCAIKDSNPKKDVSFKDDVMPLLSVCGCHNPKSAEQIGIEESGLTIEGFDGYELLREGGDRSGASMIIAGNPCDSILMQKLGETPPWGVRMPKGGPPLTLDQQTLISDWIVEGASDN